MIKPVYIYTIVFLAAIFALIVVLIATGAIPTGNEMPEDPDYTVRDKLEEPLKQGVVADVTDDTTGIQVASEITSPQDAKNLLNSHCTQCHSMAILEMIKKTRTDWEKTLEKMEMFGLNLSQTERVILIDYLAVDKSP